MNENSPFHYEYITFIDTIFSQHNTALSLINYLLCAKGTPLCWSDVSFREGGPLSRGGPTVRWPGGTRRKWGLVYTGGARGENEKEQRGAEGALEEGHPAADPAAEDGDGEPEATGWVCCSVVEGWNTQSESASVARILCVRVCVSVFVCLCWEADVKVCQEPRLFADPVGMHRHT